MFREIHDLKKKFSLFLGPPSYGSMCTCNRMYEECMNREGNMVEARNVFLMSKFQTVIINFKFPVRKT